MYIEHIQSIIINNYGDFTIGFLTYLKSKHPQSKANPKPTEQTNPKPTNQTNTKPIK